MAVDQLRQTEKLKYLKTKNTIKIFSVSTRPDWNIDIDRLYSH